MEPLYPDRLSLNLFKLTASGEGPRRTWPPTSFDQITEFDESIWPRNSKEEPDLLSEESLTHSHSNKEDQAVFVSDIVMKEGGHKMIPEVHISVESSSTSPRSSPTKSRKKEPASHIHFDNEHQELKPIPEEDLSDRVDQTGRAVLKRSTTPPQIRRALSSHFLRGPKIQRTSSAPLLNEKVEVHALRETSESESPILHLPPTDIFITVTRPNGWDRPVQPAFDEIVVIRKTDRANTSVTTISPKRDAESKITETTELYYVRLVKEIYKLQDHPKSTEFIKEQLNRLRTYQMPTGYTGSLRMAREPAVDYDAMQNELNDISCLEILRRLSMRGFAPATYASAVLWPKLFPSKPDKFNIEDGLKMDGKKVFYFEGDQICSSGEIHLKRHRISVIQRKLFEFSAVLLSGQKIPKKERHDKRKYNLIRQKVPIGSLVISMKSRHRKKEEPYYEFALRMLDVMPLRISDPKVVKSEVKYSKEDLKRAEIAQEEWLQETKEFACEQHWKKNGLMITKGFMLYPGSKYPLHKGPKSTL